MIRFEDVTFAYRTPDGAIPAVRSVSLSLEAGEVLAILGANGSGKSTLALLSNGLLAPDEGRVNVDGLDARDPDAAYAVRTKVGLVFQDPENQIVATTVEEEVAFGPENLGLPRDELRRRVDDALAQVGLSDLREAEPHQLSGGQKQRLALAGALAMSPRYLVLDEPASMLDPAGRAEVASIVPALVDAGHGVAVITHDLSVLTLADRAIVLDAGRMVFEGSPLELLAIGPDKLAAWGLEPPPLAAVAERLLAAGASVPILPSSPEELTEALWL